jgi:hypothetical protein
MTKRLRITRFILFSPLRSGTRRGCVSSHPVGGAAECREKAPYKGSVAKGSRLSLLVMERFIVG